MRHGMKKHALAAVALSLSLMILGTGVGYIAAYMTAQGPTMVNPFTIALDTRTTVVERFPDPEIHGTIIDWKKVVQIGNVGFVDAYVRVSLNFSESQIGGYTKFSPDYGKTWYSFEDYKNHLPAGWIYKDGFYYYEPILYAGEWDEKMHPKLQWREDLGEYFYNDDNIFSDPMLTTPLITMAKTTFPTPESMRSYELSVHEESVPFYFGKDCLEAFANYDAGVLSGGN